MVRNNRNSKVVALVAGISALALTLTACGSSSENADPSAPSSESPVAEVDGVPASIVGMHIEGAEGGAWAAAPFGALRMWDNGNRLGAR